MPVLLIRVSRLADNKLIRGQVISELTPPYWALKCDFGKLANRGALYLVILPHIPTPSVYRCTPAERQFKYILFASIPQNFCRFIFRPIYDHTNSVKMVIKKATNFNQAWRDHPGYLVAFVAFWGSLQLIHLDTGSKFHRCARQAVPFDALIQSFH